jgi:putative ABC transport system permease protein
MNDFALIRKNLFRKKLRAFLLSLAIFVAFLIFGTLVGFNQALDLKPQDGEAERMVTLNKVNFTQTIPFAYYGRIKSMEGVTLATHQSWFGAYFKEPKNFIVAFATDPEMFLAINKKRYGMSDSEAAAWTNDRNGILVGKGLADKFGWKVGDQVPITSNIYQRTDGGRTWNFNISAIYDSTSPTVATNALFLHWENFNESRTFGRDQIGQVVFLTKSPDINDALAKQIDEEFANSPAQTRTTTASAFNKAFLNQLGNIALIITLVVGASFISILLVVGNTMVMAIRERTREIAVLKTIGFSAARIFRMILAETILLAFVGGMLGLGASLGLLSLAAQSGFIPFALKQNTGLILEGMGLMLGLGLVTGLLPAYNAMRLNIVTGLGRD